LKTVEEQLEGLRKHKARTETKLYLTGAMAGRCTSRCKGVRCIRNANHLGDHTGEQDRETETEIQTWRVFWK